MGKRPEGAAKERTAWQADRDASLALSIELATTYLTANHHGQLIQAAQTQIKLRRMGILITSPRKSIARRDHKGDDNL